jgi:hypothetical protein
MNEEEEQGYDLAGIAGWIKDAQELSVYASDKSRKNKKMSAKKTADDFTIQVVTNGWKVTSETHGWVKREYVFTDFEEMQEFIRGNLTTCELHQEALNNI